MRGPSLLPADAHKSRILGVVLAGGQSRRMGGVDKSLLELAGKTLIQYSIERLAAQVSEIVISSNRNPSNYGAFGLPVLPDPITGYVGPLGGVLAAMRYAPRSRIQPDFVLSVAADTPFFPDDLVSVLAEKMSDDKSGTKKIVICADQERLQPTFCLWSVELMNDLKEFLESGQRKILDFCDRHAWSKAVFMHSPTDQLPPFFNVNRPEDLDLLASFVA